MRGNLLLAGLLVASLIASGCSSGKSDSNTTGTTPIKTIPSGMKVHYADGVEAPADAYPGDLPVFDERYVGDRGAGEPTVGVNAHGTAIFPSIAFDVAGGQLASTRVFISKDNGTTWEDRSPQIAGLAAAAPTSLDPYVYADPATGRLFTIDLYVGCSNLSWSDDDGASWLTNPIACGLPVNDHQTLTSGPFVAPVPATPVYPRVLYYCVNQIGASTCTHSLDGGLSWIAGQPPYPGVEAPGEGTSGGLCGGLHGHIFASEKTGTLFVPKGQCGRAQVARSTDNGLTFTQINVAPGVSFDGHDGAVSTDSAGNVYYFFLDGNTFPRLVVSRDDGASWGPVLNVTMPGVTAAKFPAITAGADGHIAFTYVGTTVKGGFAGDQDNATWSAYIGMSLNAADDTPVFASTPVRDSADPIKRGACVDRCDGMFDFIDIQIQPTTGQVWSSMVDLCNDACAAPAGTPSDPITSRGAVGVQVGGTMLGSRLP
jgi:hypothetical protein